MNVKILFVCDGLHPGGKERRMVELLKRLHAEPGVSAEIVLMSEEMAYPEVLALGFPIHFAVRRTRWDPRPAGTISAICSRLQPDVMHTWDPMTSLYIVPALLVNRCGFVNGMVTNAPPHLGFWSIGGIAACVTFPLADVVVGNSLAGLRAYRAPRQKAVCIHNGFDRARLAMQGDRSSVRADLGIMTPWAVGMVGEFKPKKDYLTFLSAAQDILTNRDDVTFLAIGSGPLLDECRAAVAERFRDRVIFTGWCSDVERVIGALDIGVLATNARLHGEGIPNVVLEYMAAGIPAIATDAGGTREILRDGLTGILVADRDVAGLSSAISRVLADSALADAMGQKGRRMVETDFTMEGMTSRFLEVYRAVAQHKALPPALLAINEDRHS